MKNLEIRHLSLADLYEEENNFVKLLNYLSPTDYIIREDTFYIREHMGIQTFVVTDDDIIVGTASIFIEPKFIRGGDSVGHIEDVVIHPDYQKTGIGRMLMEHLISLAKNSNCYKVILDCSNKVVGFYEKFGFRKHEYGMRLDINGIQTRPIIR